MANIRGMMGQAGLTERAATAKQAVQDFIQEARRMATDNLEDLQGTVEGATSRAQRSARETQEYVSDIVSERPFQTALLALAAGVLLGLLLRGRR